MKLSQLKFIDKLISTCIVLLPKKKLNQSLCTRELRSVLIIKLSAMGDALCLMPSVRMLSETFPEVKIDWLTTKRSAPDLFKGLPFLNKIILLPTNLLKIIQFLPFFLIKLFRYDLIVDCDQYYRVSELLSNLAPINSGFLSPLKGKSFSIQQEYDSNRNEKIQFKLLFEKIIVNFGEKPGPYKADLPELLTGFIPSSKLIFEVGELESIGKPILIIYPGSSGNASFRRWDFKNYLEISQRLKGHFTVIFAGGIDEIACKPLLSDGINIKYVDWINHWSLLEWAWIFKNKAAIFLGNDAGLFHVADLQGLKTVGIFGPNLYARWGSVMEGSSGVEIELGCRPCINTHLGIVPQSCSRGDVACLNLINLDDVEAIIKSSLQKNA